jgi:TrpR family trp operon transcriptional repressor
MKDGLKEFASVLARIQDERLIEELLVCMLTKRELEEVDGRWKLVKLLDQGMSQRKIAEKLKMSLCKITRGSKELKKENSAFKRVIEEYL